MFWYLILLLITYQQSAHGTAIKPVSRYQHAPGLNISESLTEHDYTNAIPKIVNNLNIHISFNDNDNDKNSVELTGKNNETTFKYPAEYELKEDHCEDVDVTDTESVVDGCLKYPNARCEYKCVGFPGGYRCVCPEGYVLMSDGKSCQVSDKCYSVVCDDGFTCANNYDGVSCIDLKCPQNFSLHPHKNKHDTWRTWHRCSRNNTSDGELDFKNVPKYFYWYEHINVVSMKTVDATKPFMLYLTQYYNEGMRWSVNSNNLSIKVNGSDTDFIKIEQDDQVITLYLVKPIQGPQVVEFEVTIRESPTVIDTIFYVQLVISEYKFGSMQQLYK